MTVAVNEITRLHQWIRATCLSDGTLAAGVSNRVYRGRVPQNGSFPAVIYAMLSDGDDVRGTGPIRIWWKPLYKIVIAGEGNNPLTVQTLADRIDVLFHGITGGSSSGIAIDYSIRKRPFFLDEVEVANKTYFQVGGQYEFGVRGV